MAEKGVASFYERTRRPEDKVFQDWVDQLDEQVRSALVALDHAADGREWLVGERITLADVTAVCAHDFLRITSPYQFDGHHYPHLEALAARCNAMPAFAETRP
jgi:glutathione S-transferase